MSDYITITTEAIKQLADTDNLGILAQIAAEHSRLVDDHKHSGRSSLADDAPVGTWLELETPFKDCPQFHIWMITTNGWGRHGSPDKILKQSRALTAKDAFILWQQTPIKRLPHTEPVIEIE